MATWELAWPTIRRHEGGLVDDPHDPGGITNHGVSLRFLRGIDPEADAETIRALTEAQAAAILRREFWDRQHLDDVESQGVATKIADTSVNVGNVRAGQIVQMALVALGELIRVDGMIGPRTIVGINDAPPELLLFQIREHQAAYYRALVERRPALGRFLKGWLARAAE